MIAIVKIHIRNYLEDIFRVVREFWTTNSPMQTTLINVVEQIAIALGGEFKIYVPYLIPHILRVFAHDNSIRRSVTVKLLGDLLIHILNKS
jgi:FKBP12-rapamycin complex-associated protein